MKCCLFGAEASALAPVWPRFIPSPLCCHLTVISKDMKTSKPSVFLSVLFTDFPLFYFPHAYSLDSHVFIVLWQMLTATVRLVIGKWMQRQRPCRVSRKSILEYLHNAFQEKVPPNQKLQRSVILCWMRVTLLKMSPLGHFFCSSQNWDITHPIRS